MSDYVNKFRFFIPPIFILVFAFLFNPNRFLDIFERLSLGKDIDAISVLFGGSLLILTVGFIISSLGAFIINLGGWTISKKNRKKSWNINQSEIAKIEFKNWRGVASDDMKYIRDQIDKRWQMFVVNFNMCITLFLIFIMGFISERCYSPKVWASLAVISIVLIFNSISTFNSVHSLDECVHDKK